MSTMTLTEFLLARIAEDEGWARQCIGRQWRANGSDLCSDLGADESRPFDISRTSAGGPYASPWSNGGMDYREAASERFATAHHAARHDPAHVLADCEAKRAIVDLHSATDQAQWYGDDDPPEDGLGIGCTTCGTANEYAVRWPCKTLALLASVYSDHPDYLPRWAP